METRSSGSTTSTCSEPTDVPPAYWIAVSPRCRLSNHPMGAIAGAPPHRRSRWVLATGRETPSRAGRGASAGSAGTAAHRIRTHSGRSATWPRPGRARGSRGGARATSKSGWTTAAAGSPSTSRPLRQSRSQGCRGRFPGQRSIVMLLRAGQSRRPPRCCPTARTWRQAIYALETCPPVVSANTFSIVRAVFCFD